MTSDCYILKDGKPHAVPVLEWERWFKLLENRVVEKTFVGTTEVSTVFIGLDHNFSGHGPPLLFESMVFGMGDDGDGETRRYATLGEAKRGHWEIVEKLRATAGPQNENAPAEPGR